MEASLAAVAVHRVTRVDSQGNMMRKNGDRQRVPGGGQATNTGGGRGDEGC